MARDHDCARDCSAELIADVKRHGTCLRGWCPYTWPQDPSRPQILGSTIADSDGDDGA